MAAAVVGAGLLLRTICYDLNRSTATIVVNAQQGVRSDLVCATGSEVRFCGEGCACILAGKAHVDPCYELPQQAVKR